MSIKEKTESQEYYNIYNKWKLMDLFASFFGVIGLSLGIISYEYDIRRKLVYVNYYFYKSESENDKNAMHHDRFNDSSTKNLRWLIFVSSVIAVFFLSMRNWYRK